MCCVAGHNEDDSSLREGFTTGTAAAAAAKAAVSLLVSGGKLDSVDTPLPTGDRKEIRIEDVSRENKKYRAIVIKDAGDDPDVTNGCEIHALVWQDRFLRQGEIQLLGGTGIGRVTLPGLPVEVGEWAINPEPRKQIVQAVHEVLNAEDDASLSSGLRVQIEIPKGEELADKTMNPRLGIVGGLSILGTRGTVKPFSHASYEASIAQGLEVARRQDLTTICLTTGWRSEKYLKQQYPSLLDCAFIQVADMVGKAMELSVAKGFESVIWGCFPGKLVKMGQGLFNTHAHGAEIDFNELAETIHDVLGSTALYRDIANANTVRQVMDLLQDAESKEIYSHLARKALWVFRKWTGSNIALTMNVFDFDGSLLASQSLEGTA